MKTNDDMMTAHDKRKARQQARGAEIRVLPASELTAVCTPGEMAGELNQRAYFAQMNQKELEFQATFDPDAAAELARRNGELPR